MFTVAKITWKFPWEVRRSSTVSKGNRRPLYRSMSSFRIQKNRGGKKRWVWVQIEWRIDRCLSLRSTGKRVGYFRMLLWSPILLQGCDVFWFKCPHSLARVVKGVCTVVVSPSVCSQTFGWAIDLAAQVNPTYRSHSLPVLGSSKRVATSHTNHDL